MGLEQYIDMNPWEGLRFGAFNPPSSGELTGIAWMAIAMTWASVRRKPL